MAPDAAAAAGARACEKLSLHFARIIGETGIRALLDRSLALSRSEFPWLPGVEGTSIEARCARLADSLAGQPPRAASEASALVLRTLIGLLGRFIGVDLTLRLLEERWPEETPPGGSKETT